MHVCIYSDPPPPKNIEAKMLSAGDDSNNYHIQFTWSQVTPCHAVHYNIRAINCGTCPHSAYKPSAVCIKMKHSSNMEVCTFKVQTVLCGEVAGEFSDPFHFAVKGKSCSAY